MKDKYFVLVLFVAGLLACVSEDDEGRSPYLGPYYHYQCNLDKTFQLAFMPNEPDVLLRLPKRDYRLQRAEAASGEKYTLHASSTDDFEPVSLHLKGNHAFLSLGSEIYRNCITP